MDSIDREALTSLTTTFEALMPDVTAPQLPLRVALDPLGSAPAGVGGVIGISHSPPGEIRARRLRALARVGVSTTDASGLDAAVTEVTAAVLAGDGAAQRAQGLLGTELVEVGPETSNPAAGGGTRFGREVRFRLLFEHLQLPTEAGDVIDEIRATVADEPVVVEAPAPGPLFAPRGLVTEPAFEVVDDPRATRAGPSAWRFDAASGRFLQTSGIWGGTRTRTPNKPGTYLLLERGPFADARFEVLLGAAGTGAVGLVFRWQDTDNFYFALLQGDPSFRLLGRKLDGAFSTIAVQEGGGLVPGATHRVALTVEGSRFSASVDGGSPLTGEDSALAAPGRLGLMTHNEAGGFFTVSDLSELAPPSRGGS